MNTDNLPNNEQRHSMNETKKKFNKKEYQKEYTKNYYRKKHSKSEWITDDNGKIIEKVKTIPFYERIKTDPELREKYLAKKKLYNLNYWSKLKAKKESPCPP